ncbi:aminotransferase class V-fold PLP-dependent enzyme [bacterium]|nr:aminotransferase class V-fold PLP-dependent enzyme [bacterium]
MSTPFFPEAPPAPPVQAVGDEAFEAFLAEYRDSQPITRKFTYLNHASVGPLSDWVIEAANEHLRQQQMAETVIQHAWFDGWRLCRQRMGELIGAGRHEICLHPNTNVAAIRVFNSLPVSPGDEVVCTADDFPSLWHSVTELTARGARRVQAQSSRGDGIVRVEDVLEAITARTTVVAVSWVNFFHGYTMDLELLGRECGERGIWLVVDAIQGLGGLAIDIKKTGVPFFICNGAKWMLSPLGSGFMYVSEDVPAEITPRSEGWFSLELNHLKYTDRTVKAKANANRFGTGTVDFAANFGLRRSCEIFMTAGAQRASERALGHADRLDELARELEIPVFSDRRCHDGSLAPWRSPIVGLNVKDYPALSEELSAASVVFSVREGILRLSPHWYLSDAEIGRVCDIIASHVRQHSPVA